MVYGSSVQVRSAIEYPICAWRVIVCVCVCVYKHGCMALLCCRCVCMSLYTERVTRHPGSGTGGIGRRDQS